MFLHPKISKEKEDLDATDVSCKEIITEENALFDNDHNPLMKLQLSLQAQFPMCSDIQKHGSFTPHMTLSHFPSIKEAKEAQTKMEETWKRLQKESSSSLKFTVNEVYLLKRIGDEGQFKIAATLPLKDATKIKSINLGDHSAELGTRILSSDATSTDLNIDGRGFISLSFHDPMLTFSGMPLSEEEWVYEERIKLKQRRNRGGKRRRWKGKQRTHGNSEDNEEKKKEENA